MVMVFDTVVTVFDTVVTVFDTVVALFDTVVAVFDTVVAVFDTVVAMTDTAVFDTVFATMLETFAVVAVAEDQMSGYIPLVAEGYLRGIAVGRLPLIPFQSKLWRRDPSAEGEEEIDSRHSPCQKREQSGVKDRHTEKATLRRPAERRRRRRQPDDGEDDNPVTKTSGGGDVVERQR
ncbi:hypothetical protein LXL04_024886 [Taraxacum kok-saghyz]